MPLPEGFNDYEHLSDQVRIIHNKRVLEWFREVPDLDISTPRASLKQACLIKDEDSHGQVQMRQWLFEVTAGHARSLQPDIYGIPVTTFHDSIAFKPQVTLYFLESQRSVEDGYSAVEGEISFRLTESQYENVTPAEARSLALKVKAAMATPVFVWKKGRMKITYKDTAKGYDFRILATTEAEGKRLIEQTLDIRSHTPDWDNLTVHEARKNFPIIPPTKTIYGKSRKTPRQRPRADVRFRYATLNIHGMPNPVTLVDVTGFRHKPLETA